MQVSAQHRSRCCGLRGAAADIALTIRNTPASFVCCLVDTTKPLETFLAVRISSANRRADCRERLASAISRLDATSNSLTLFSSFRGIACSLKLWHNSCYPTPIVSYRTLYAMGSSRAAYCNAD